MHGYKKLIASIFTVLMLVPLFQCAVAGEFTEDELIPVIDVETEQIEGDENIVQDVFVNDADISPDKTEKDDLLAALEKQGHLYLTTSGKEFSVYADANREAEICKVVKDGPSVLFVDGFENDMIHVVFADQFGAVKTGYIGVGSFTLLSDEDAPGVADFFSLTAVQNEGQIVYSTEIFVEEINDIAEENESEEIVVDIAPEAETVDVAINDIEETVNEEKTEEVIDVVPDTTEPEEVVVDIEEPETMPPVEDVDDQEENPAEKQEETIEDAVKDIDEIVDVETDEEKTVVDNVDPAEEVVVETVEVAPVDETEEVPAEAEDTAEETPSEEIADESSESEAQAEETSSEDATEEADENAEESEVTEEEPAEETEEAEEELIDINPEIEGEVVEGGFAMVKAGALFYNLYYEPEAHVVNDAIIKITRRTIDNDGNDVYVAHYWISELNGSKLYGSGCFPVSDVVPTFEEDYSLVSLEY